MSRRTSAGALVTILGTFACLTCMMISGQPIALAAPKDDPDFPEVREIDLSTIYTSSDQKKLKLVYGQLDEKSEERKAYDTIGRALSESRSPPGLTVVRGENIKEAILATARFIKLKDPPAGPVGPDDKSTTKKLWLFVHIAHDSSSPPQWLIYPPTVFANKVRFTYTHFDGWFSPDPDEGRSASADEHPYYYWVPLGEVARPTELRAEMVELSKTVKASYPAKKKK